MNLKYLMIAAAALAAPLAMTAPVQADGGVFVGVDGSKIAVSGYDTVSYFQGDGIPVKGDAVALFEPSQRRQFQGQSGCLHSAIWWPLRLGDEPRFARAG